MTAPLKALVMAVVIVGGSGLPGAALFRSPGSAAAVGATYPWAQARTPTAPRATHSAAMADDPIRDEVVLYDNHETWIWDGSTWIRKISAHVPAIDFGSMAFDGRQVVLFGSTGVGNASGCAEHQTWTWDGATWSPAQTPAPLAHDTLGGGGGALAFDRGHHNVVLFGGGGCANQEADETWIWDGAAWSPRNPAQSPPGTEGMGMAYDGRNVVLFGGQQMPPPSPSDGDPTSSTTWTWDGSTWTPHLGPAPAPRLFPSVAYDPSLQQVVLFGGSSGADVDYADTWTWDGSLQIWTARAPAAGLPPPRENGSMASGTHGGVVLFGGTEETAAVDGDIADTWISSPLSDVTATTAALTSSANPAVAGMSVTFSVAVSPVAGSTIPTGTVTFRDGAASLGASSLVESQAFLTNATLSTGTHLITAAYGGDGANLPSVSAPLAEVIVPPNGNVPRPPAITTIDPDCGSTSFPTTVTIAGTALGGALSVTFGSVPATSFSVDPLGTQITATTAPQAPKVAVVTVTTSGGRATHAFAFQIACQVVSQTPGPSGRPLAQVGATSARGDGGSGIRAGGLHPVSSAMTPGTPGGASSQAPFSAQGAVSAPVLQPGTGANPGMAAHRSKAEDVPVAAENVHAMVGWRDNGSLPDLAAGAAICMLFIAGALLQLRHVARVRVSLRWAC